MQLLRANQALLPEGWVENVLVEVADDGLISSVNAVREDADHSGTPLQVGSLLPAPVNAHSHAFQRAMAGLTEKRGPDPTDSFWTWRQLMYRFLDRLTPEHIEAITAFVQMEMLEAGYATNVEFHYLHHQPNGAPYENLAELSERIAAAAKQSGIGLTLLPVHYQYGGCDKRELGSGQIRFGNDIDRFAKIFDAAKSYVKSLTPDCGVGLAPHSLRAVAPENLPDLISMASDAPFHMHLAEQIPEVIEIEAAWGKRPVEWLMENADVKDNWCLIHCTQMMPHETSALARSGAVAGLCPITEANLGDGIFDGVRWFEENGRIAIGSDSNIRISLSEELRTLDYSQRLRDHSRAALATEEKSTGRRLFEAAASGGAQAAGRNSGQIKAGMWADLIALDGDHPDLAGRKGDTLLDCYIFAGDDRMIEHVWSAGRHKVQEGRHVSRSAITNQYLAAIAELGDAI